MGSSVPIQGNNAQIEGQTKLLVLPDQFIVTLKGSTTPSVKNITRVIFANTGAVTVTDLKDGQNGQQLKILGDGNTTLAQNTNIVLNGGGGGNVLLAANTLYELVRFNGKWYGKP